MDRLTVHIGDTVGMAWEHEEKHTMDEWVDMLQTRLCEYEDTGLTPEEVNYTKLYAMGKAVAEIVEFDGVPIDRLKELAQLDKHGLLKERKLRGVLLWLIGRKP